MLVWKFFAITSLGVCANQSVNYSHIISKGPECSGNTMSGKDVHQKGTIIGKISVVEDLYR